MDEQVDIQLLRIQRLCFRPSFLRQVVTPSRWLSSRPSVQSSQLGVSTDSSLPTLDRARSSNSPAARSSRLASLHPSTSFAPNPTSGSPLELQREREQH